MHITVSKKETLEILFHKPTNYAQKYHFRLLVLVKLRTNYAQFPFTN